jgi:hypothetical protein
MNISIIDDFDDIGKVEEDSNDIVKGPVCKPTHRFISSKYTVAAQVKIPLYELINIIEWYNKDNRPMLHGRVNQYAEDIKSNNFDYNAGNPIRFDINGNLLDGQNRIQAHILASKPFEKVTVIYGLDPKSMKHIDENIPRNTTTRLLLSKGLPLTGNRKTVTAQISIARCLNWVENGFKTYKTLSIDVLDKTIQERQDAISFACQPCQNSNTRRVGYRTAMAQYFEKSPAKAAEFFKLVGGDGACLPSGSPALHLRNYLAKTFAGGGQQMKDDYWCAVSMINNFQNNNTVQRISRANAWAF